MTPRERFDEAKGQREQILRFISSLDLGNEDDQRCIEMLYEKAQMCDMLYYFNKRMEEVE